MRCHPHQTEETVIYPHSYFYLSLPVQSEGIKIGKDKRQKMKRACTTKDSLQKKNRNVKICNI